MVQKLRAIDLYSGVGGWSLGLALAGVEVVASYERWADANRTNELNNRHRTHTVDIRALALSDLPNDIDIVVGSPPCTEFSFSNRGGGGDIKDGLRDIVKFLTIVDHLKPRFWVMENVPRVAAIVEKELGKRGRLARFRHLEMRSVVINMEDFGVPQRRKRCLIGNLNFDLLNTYAGVCSPPTLGAVVAALAQDPVRDPVFGLSLPRSGLRDHDPETFLDAEERRINEAAKTAHPVYNSMPFPDPLDRAVRTITATCTRVSRESVVIEPPSSPGRYRRLTVRERASLQGFPISYQFYGTSYGHKLRMVGNAVPPAFSFHVAHAMLGTSADALPSLSKSVSAFLPPVEAPPSTLPETNGRHFPASRSFRFAVPHLRLKSGVRFEMVNLPNEQEVGWAVRFYFGTSKDICDISLDADLGAYLRTTLPPDRRYLVEQHLDGLSQFLAQSDLRRMQAVWSHRGPGGVRPFEVLDRIGTCAAEVVRALSDAATTNSIAAIEHALSRQYGSEVSTLPGLGKLRKNACLIHAGLLVGTAANIVFGSMRASGRIPKAEVGPTLRTAAN